MSNVLLDYLQRELDTERGVVDGLEKVAAELDTLDYDELQILNTQLDQEGLGFEKAAEPVDMQGWADAMGRYLARGEMRKVAAANGDVSGAIMSEAVELLTGGHIRTMEDGQVAMQKIATLEKFGGDTDEKWVRPGWGDQLSGMNRAMRQGDTTWLDRSLAAKELLGERMNLGTRGMLKGLTLGGAGGAGLGALVGLLGGAKGDRLAAALTGVGLGAILGGGLGATIGEARGLHQADKKYLEGKGVKLRRLGLAADFTPEAHRKYIGEYRDKKRT